MKKCLAVVLLLVLVACTTRVIETSSEIRPSRYAVLEFTQPLAMRDSALAHARRALRAEGLELQSGNADSGVLTAGPAHFPAAADQPELSVTIAINVVTAGAATTFRLYASSVIEADELGGVDARLRALLDRLAARIQAEAR